MKRAEILLHLRRIFYWEAWIVATFCNFGENDIGAEVLTLILRALHRKHTLKIGI
jgi:hypothetical protein